MSAAQISESSLLSPTRHVFLSPHYDDIALSCGGTAARLSSGGKTPEVALIFGDHPDPNEPMHEFAEFLHDQWGLTAGQVIASRRAEEANASKVLGATDRFLPFRDAIYRGRRYMNDAQLFSVPAEDEADLYLGIMSEAGIDGDVTGLRVYAPLGIGFHVDHQHAFRAGIELTRRGADVWFYEDLPYGLNEGALERRIARAGVPLEPAVLVDVATTWEAKLDAIFAYPSQLITVFVDYVSVGTSRPDVDAAMSAYHRKVGNGALCERFWKAAV